MNSRERVARCLRHEEPDLVPIVDTLLPVFIERYRKARGLSESIDLRDYFGFDIRTVSCRSTPSLLENRVLERDGELEVFSDGWGLVVRRWVAREGVPQVLRSAIQGEEDLEHYFQDPNDDRRYEGLADAIQRIHDRNLAAFFTISDHWGGLYHIFGLKNLLKLVHRSPRLIRKTIRKLTAHYSAIIANVLEHEIDCIWVFGDLATNSGPFISPSMYEDLLDSAQRAVLRPVKSRGIPVMFHSDGDIRPLIPMMLGEGVTAIQPLDALAGMDVLELKEKYGDRLAFMGNIPNKSVLPRGTPEEVASEVRRKLVAGQGGGYILASSHSIAEDVPPDNFDAMLRAGRRFGRYPL